MNVATVSAIRMDESGPGACEILEIIEGEPVWRNGRPYDRAVANSLADELNIWLGNREPDRIFQRIAYRMRPNHPVTIPDVSFVSFVNWQLRVVPRNKESWHIVPNLAAEVISPSDKMGDVMIKLRRHFEAGVQSVWHLMPFIDSVYVYDSPTKINVFSLGDDLVCPTLFPRWKLPLQTLFPRESEE